MPFQTASRGPWTFGKNIFKFPPSQETWAQARSVVIRSASVLPGYGDVSLQTRRLEPGTILVWADTAHQYVRPYSAATDDTLDRSKVAGISWMDEDFTDHDGPVGVMYRGAVFLSAQIVGVTAGNIAAVRASFPNCEFE